MSETSTSIKVGWQGPMGTEFVWAKPTDGGYQIENVPFFAPFNYKDIVQVEERDGATYFTSVSEASGHRTLRVNFSITQSRGQQDRIIQGLPKGVEGERYDNHYVVFDVPPTDGLWEQTKAMFERMLGNEIARVYSDSPQLAEDVASEATAYHVERAKAVARVLDSFKHSLETFCFGALLSALLKGLHLSGKDLAEKAGIDPSYVSRLINNDVKQPNATTVDKIIAALALHGTNAADALMVSAGHYPIYYKKTAIYLALNPQLREQLAQAMQAIR